MDDAKEKNKTTGSADTENISNESEDLLYEGIRAKGDYLYTYNDKVKKYVRSARRVDIKKILADIDTGVVTLYLEFKYRGSIKSIKLPREELNRRDLFKYQKYGLNINEYNAGIIIKHLDNQEQKTKIEKVHECVGWGMYQGNPVYRHYTAIGVKSKYAGNLDIMPRGSLEGWKKIIEKCVMGYIPSEVGLLFGLSAVVVGFLGLYHPVDSLVIHKYSDSSKGKTSIDMAAVSVYGSPEQKDNTLMVNWNATVNSIMADLAQNFGLATVLDEASMAGQKDFSSILYILAGGNDKRRMNKDLSKRKAGRWLTIIIINGEHSLYAKSNHNTGLRVRLFEYANVVWTMSATAADKIKAGVLENYGHAGPEMAKKILEMGSERVTQIWQSWCDKCFDAMEEKDQFSHRISKKLAILMAAAEIAEEALGLEFDKAGVLQFLLKHNSEASEERDLPQKAYDYFLDQFNIRNKHFIKKHDLSDVPATNNEIWGSVIKRPDGVTEVAIITTIFERMMREGNFSDTKIVLKAWKQRELLDCEKDRLTRSRKISDQNPINVYVVLIKSRQSPKKKRKAGEDTGLEEGER